MLAFHLSEIFKRTIWGCKDKGKRRTGKGSREIFGAISFNANPSSSPPPASNLFASPLWPTHKKDLRLSGAAIYLQNKNQQYHSISFHHHSMAHLL
jgi:hypothetical protein